MLANDISYNVLLIQLIFPDFIELSLQYYPLQFTFLIYLNLKFKSTMLNESVFLIDMSCKSL